MKYQKIQEQNFSYKLSNLQKFSLDLLCKPINEIDSIVNAEIESNPLIEYKEEYSSSRYANLNTIDNIASEESLYDHIYKQLVLIKGNYDREIIDLLLMNINSEGYISKDVIDFLMVSNEDPNVIEENLAILKKCDPKGIGACDLKEKIILQLDPNDKYYDIAFTIVDKYLLLLGNDMVDTVISKVGCSYDEYNEAISLIRKCNPYPLSQFKKNINYIISDVEITFDDEFEIIVNKPRYSIKISEKFNIYELKEYMKKYLARTQKLINALELRNETLFNIVKIIVDTNCDYLKGIGNMHPLTMTKTSELLHVNKSTISRAVANKYIKINESVYPIKHFFSRDTLNLGIAQNDVIQLVKEIIDNENKCVYSDKDIVSILSQKGIKISRRTVTKYRLLLGFDNYKRRVTTKGEKHD